MTAFRRLSELSYLSSYSHAGRYYTLPDIPQFDPDGLWLHGGVGFSRHGTLKDTVPVLVDRSESGVLHRELQRRLQVRVHNTLLDLVRTKRELSEAFGCPVDLGDIPDPGTRLADRIAKEGVALVG